VLSLLTAAVVEACFFRFVRFIGRVVDLSMEMIARLGIWLFGFPFDSEEHINVLEVREGKVPHKVSFVYLAHHLRSFGSTAHHRAGVVRHAILVLLTGTGRFFIL
jgi:hypothetical protein